MRLVTRADFDGLACAVLLVDAGVVDSFQFVHPKDVQDGLVRVTESDVLANVPLVPGCGLWFDHHSSEDERLRLMSDFPFRGASRPAPSCARVVYEFYGEEKFRKFDESGLMAAVDKSDSGDLTIEDIRDPKGWILLSYVMDPRTGLGRYQDYRIGNEQLMRDMIEYCRTMTADRILELPDVKERVDRYFAQQKDFEAALTANTKIHGNVILTDFRGLAEIPTGNRFTVYALYPKQNVSILIVWGKGRKNVAFNVGHSIFNRTSKTDVGALMLKHDGGGHRQVGTCQVPIGREDRVLADLLLQMKADG